FRDRGDFVTFARERHIEGETHDAFAAFLGKQAGLNGNRFARSARAEVQSTDAGVFALSVFAHHYPVHVFGGRGLQRTWHARQEPHGSDVRVLVEALTDGQPQTPQADVVRHTWPADGAEVDRVMGFEALEAIRV